MRYYANASTLTIVNAILADPDGLGYIDTPGQGAALNIPPDALDDATWCADNGCYGKAYVGDDAWLDWLAHRTPHRRHRCQFATAPDVVGDAAATLVRSRPWLPIIRSLGYPAAFVGQDGSTDCPPPWGEFDVLFLGGTDTYKLGPEARHDVAQARERGVPVHMGRVNSGKRMRYAEHIGVDSADGTYLTFGPDVNTPKVQAWMRQVNDQHTLWPA